MNNLKYKTAEEMQDGDMQGGEMLPEIINQVCLLSPPAWNLRDIVAVNPFLGYLNKHPLETHKRLKSILGADILPTMEIFRELLNAGKFSDIEILNSYEELSKNYSAKFGELGLTKDYLLSLISNNLLEESVDKRKVSTFADLVDLRQASAGRWRTAILVDLSRFCSAKFDEGVTLWRARQSSNGLFEDWRDYALNSHAMYARGLSQFKTFVRSLPVDPLKAISQMLEHLGDNLKIEKYLAALLGDVPGWAGYLRQKAWQVGHSEVGQLPALLAIRMAYDISLLLDPKLSKYCSDDFSKSLFKEPADLEKTSLIKMILLRATELKVEKDVLSELNKGTVSNQTGRPLCQAVFCIDVRSEVLRRHLNQISSQIETFGFAGFFGLPISTRNSQGEVQDQCPVLLAPSIEVSSDGQAIKEVFWQKKLVKVFSKLAVSSFSYVESFGFLSIFSMLKGLGKKFQSNDEEISSITSPSIKLEDRLKLALGILKNLSLNAPFARLILLCGHESRPVNNPQAAALGCGACGGHSGRANALFASELLNDKEVPEALAEIGWSIPEDTLVIAGVHETITDEIKILSQVPSSYGDELNELKNSLLLASSLAREERATRFPKEKVGIKEAAYRRLSDISETRPEWALAGNAALIAGSKELIRNANLNGRAFLHNYIEEIDRDNSVLETILTAPVVVASWINLQYFASSVDPKSFGSGNKTIHNIVGGIGVICGNDGDLAVGLSHQSVHDGDKLQHDPVRLQVFIEAKKERITGIVNKHQMLRELVGNEWIIIHSILNTGHKVELERIMV